MVCDYLGSVVKVEFVKGLNPYSIGIWSATPQVSDINAVASKVLILILLEYGLRLNRPQSHQQRLHKS